MYDLFGRYGAIRQIRLGSAKDTQGTAFVVFEDIFDAKKVSVAFVCRHVESVNGWTFLFLCRHVSI